MLWSERSRDFPIKACLNLPPSFVFVITPNAAIALFERMFLFGRLAPCCPDKAEGSPFQMPARLADGLGLESGLGAGCPAPFAPSPDSIWRPGNLVPPRPASGRKRNLGCYREPNHKRERLSNPPRQSGRG